MLLKRMLTVSQVNISKHRINKPATLLIIVSRIDVICIYI